MLHIRCGLFFTNLLLDLDGLAQGVLTTAARPDRPMPWVAPRDVGDVVAVRLLSDPWQGGVQAVHGPEDLTFTQVAEILTPGAGPARLEVVGDDEVRAALRSVGLPPSAVEGVVGMTAGSRDLVPEQPRDLVATTPTTLGVWAHANLRPMLG